MMFPITHWSKNGLLLDLVPGAVAAYSSRKLRTSYTGSAMRVRRSNDNAEQDIGFTSTGLLDTAALLSFTGSNSGYVTKWYDQSTGGNDLLQATAGAQPQIVSSGTVLTGANSRPRLNVNGSQWLGTSSSPANLSFERTSQFSVFLTAKLGSAGTNRFYWGKSAKSGSSTGSGYYTYFDNSISKIGFIMQNSSNVGLYSQRSGSTTISTSNNYLISSINSGTGNASGMSLRVNGTAETMSTPNDNLSGSIQNSIPFTIFSRQDGDVPWVGDIMELFVWPSALTGSTLAVTESNMKIFFNL